RPGDELQSEPVCGFSCAGSECGRHAGGECEQSAAGRGWIGCEHTERTGVRWTEWNARRLLHSEEDQLWTPRRICVLARSKDVGARWLWHRILAYSAGADLQRVRAESTV